jgi:hypothetical protein
MGMFTDLIPQQFTPQEQKWSDEAAAVGLTWIKKKDNDVSIYIFSKCNHEQEIKNYNVRDKKFTCRFCKNEKYKNEALSNGNIEWLYQSRHGYGLYRFVACNHKQEISNSMVRIGSFKCSSCQNEKYINEAIENGRIKWICKIRPNYSKYIFLSCNHEQEIAHNNVKNGLFRCRECQIEKFKNEALQNKIVDWVRKTKPHYGLYRFIKCGHEQEISNTQVRTNYYACQTCKDTWATKPSNVYVHSIDLQGETIIKVGIAQNVQHRIKGYGLPPKAIVRTVMVIPTKTGKEASDIETMVLSKFKPYRAKNIGHIMVKSGETECFYASKLSEILAFTKSVVGVK